MILLACAVVLVVGLFFLFRLDMSEAFGMIYTKYQLKSGVLQARANDIGQYEFVPGYSGDELSAYEWRVVTSRKFSGLNPAIDLIERQVSEVDNQGLQADRKGLIHFGGFPGSIYWLEVKNTGEQITSEDDFAVLFAPVSSEEEAASFIYGLKQGEGNVATINVASVTNGYVVWRIQNVSAVEPVPACGSKVRVTLGDVYLVSNGGDVERIGKLDEFLTVSSGVCF